MHAIEEADFPRAAALLHEGFPQRSPSFWLQALQRMALLGENEAAGVPIGWLLLHEQQAVGVVLTPASLRYRRGGSVEKLVNFSSWYVRPAFRWRAFLMLRALLADRAAVYTDLTPTREVQQMLGKLGFTPINHGVALLPTPLLALGPRRGASVRLLQPGELLPDCELTRAQVEGHRALGCLPLLLQAPGQPPQLLVCRRTRWRGLPVAQLVYAERMGLLLQHRAALARCLLQQGLLMFVHEARSARSTALAWFRPRDQWFCRGGDFSDRCDAFASELCIVHADAVLQPPTLPLRPDNRQTLPSPAPAPSPVQASAPGPACRSSGAAPAPC